MANDSDRAWLQLLPEAPGDAATDNWQQLRTRNIEDNLARAIEKATCCAAAGGLRVARRELADS